MSIDDGLTKELGIVIKTDRAKQAATEKHKSQKLMKHRKTLNKPMTLNEYIMEQQEFLSSFVSYWEQQAKINPDAFPPTFPPGDWDEQLASWKDSL